jgi:hypothetical protein
MEVGKLLDQPDVLQKRWTTRAGSLDVKVVDDGDAGCA